MWRSACKDLLRINPYSEDRIFYQYCTCFTESDPLQLHWAPESTSSSADLASPLAFNLTEHNTTQPLLDDTTTDEHHVCDQVSTRVIAPQQQEVLTISPSLLHLPNSVSTTSLSYGTPSPVHLQPTSSQPPGHVHVADTEQACDLPR